MPKTPYIPILSSFRTYRVALLIVAVSTFLLTYPLYYATEKQTPLKQVVERLKDKLAASEQDFYELCENKHLIERIVQNTYSADEAEALQRLPYSFFVYQNGELLYWNSNDIAPPEAFITAANDFVTLDKLKNGYYQIIGKKYHSNSPTQQGVYLIATQLIKYDYSFQNNYVVNEPNPILGLGSTINFGMPHSTESEEYYYPLSCDFDKSFLRVTYDKYKLEKRVNAGIAFLQTIAIFIILIIIHTFALDIIKQKKVLLGFTLLAISFSCIRLLMLGLKVPLSLSNSWLFDSINYKTAPIFLSPGELLITLFFSFWVLVFFYRHVTIQLPVQQMTPAQRVAAYIIISLIALLWFSGLAFVVKALSVDFLVPFEFELINLLNFLGLIGLVSLSLSIILFFLLMLKTADLAAQLKLNPTQRALALIPMVAISFALAWVGFFANEWHYWQGIAILSVLIWASGKFSEHIYHYPTLKRTVFWVMIFASFATLLVYGFGMQKERENRRNFANRIAVQEDPLTEYLFEDVAKKIMLQDDTIRQYFKTPILPSKLLLDRIKKVHMNAHFDKYEIKMYNFDSLETPIADALGNDVVQLEDFELKIRHKSFRTKNDYLFLTANSATGGYAYLAKLVFFDTAPDALLPLGYMILEMIPKADKQTNVYPELTIEDKYRQPKEYTDYSYAIYHNEQLESHGGTYDYPYKKENIFAKDTSLYTYLNHKGFSHLVHRVNPQQTVVISKGQRNLWGALSLFSYLCLLTVCVMVLVMTVNALLHARSVRLGLRTLFYATLRKRINLAMVMILLFSFTVIGFITITYFYTNSTENYQKRLEQKQKEILTALQQALQKEAESIETPLYSELDRNDLFQIVSSLSEVHGIDINIYDSHGFLRSCSQPAIFDKGLITKIIHPEAFFQITRNFKTVFMQNEQIGKLSFLSSYMPIRNEANRIIGFLNIPYFAQEKELRSEISAFMVALINVYVILLITASMLAIFLANSITQPLAMISEKLGNIKLGQKNEALFWPDDDEIGKLVQRYNLTVQQLEHSAKLLASSERQQAWQQMARQVAHEIKNPLTPMKLSIQHLQRAHKDNHPRLNEMLERMTQTLIEQIDTLSQIASAFSDFAKMPKPQNELFDIRTVIENVVNLLENTDETKFFQKLPEKPCMVFADKNQLLRVFNNLLKNAMQAIPDERKGIIVVNLKKTNNSVIVAVTDNGTGIADEQKEKVFVPNFTTKNSGMGLGLAMSRNIIETANGKIWFESKENEGTTFFIRLPLHQRKYAEEIEQQPLHA